MIITFVSLLSLKEVSKVKSLWKFSAYLFVDVMQRWEVKQKMLPVVEPKCLRLYLGLFYETGNVGVNYDIRDVICGSGNLRMTQSESLHAKWTAFILGSTAY